MKKILSFLLPILIAAALLIYTYQGQDFSTMSSGLKEVHIGALIATFVSTFIAHWFRAIRWNMLFEPVGYSPSKINSFLAVMSGYFTNLIIPRAGEVSRCTILLTSEKIPLQTSIGTVLAERGLDLVMLILIALVAFGLEFETLSQFLSQQQARFGGGEQTNLKLILGLIFLGVIVFGFYFRKPLSKIPIVTKILDFAKGLMEGLFSAVRLKNPVLFILYTLIIWGSYFMTTYLSLYMFDFTFDLGIKAAFMLLIIGSFGIIVPVPSAVGGPFQAFVSAALVTLYMKNPVMSLVAATMMYYSQQFFTAVLGGACYLASVVKANKMIPEN
jgi:uncharacterized protein (TIRG00374 family)